MSTFHRTLWVVVSLTVLAQSRPTLIEGAELRTTACDRPVCRSVAISPAAPSRQDRKVRQASLTTDAVFDEYQGEHLGEYHGDFHGDFHGDCQGNCGGGCSNCCLPPREVWVGFDFLLGWRHGIRTPPLVTTSPNGTAQADAGVLPGATVVYPTQPFGEEARPGGRLSLGAWLDRTRCWALEGRYFMLADQNTNFAIASVAGDPILARPFFDVLGNVQAARLLAFPGFVEPGGVNITSESQLQGGDALLRRRLCDLGTGDLQFLVGYQFAQIDEALVIADLSTDADPGNLIQDGTTLAITDRFSTRNQYNAASVGAAWKMQNDNLTWEILGKVGLGNMRETVMISGTTVTTVPGQAAVENAVGLLAQGVNLGTFTQDRFCASPEVNLKCSYQVNDHIDVSCGYTFLYFTSSVQPGQQIDVDLRVPPDGFRIRDTEYWMHAFQCGVNVRF